MEYKKNGIIEEIQRSEAWLLAPISVIARENDPLRPREILDFTGLNKYIMDADCALPARKDLVKLVNNYKFAASIDIKSCNTNIPLNKLILER